MENKVKTFRKSRKIGFFSISFFMILVFACKSLSAQNVSVSTSEINNKISGINNDSNKVVDNETQKVSNSELLNNKVSKINRNKTTQADQKTIIIQNNQNKSVKETNEVENAASIKPRSVKVGGVK